MDTSNQNPSSVNVRSFIAARATEIASLTATIGQSGESSHSFSFQHVKKHMRRRAVSHNPKRVPTRLREHHLAQVTKRVGNARPKKPSKLHRKRPAGVLEFNQRQLNNPTWLESHIWHAKRFFMQKLWGKKIAIAPTAKCFRSLFKAAQESIVMQDISYLCCLELQGNKEVLVSNLNQLFPPDYNEYSVKSTYVQSGHQEFVATVIIPPKDCSPSQYVGTVKYLFIPCELETEARCMIWIHPGLESFLVNALLEIFQLVQCHPPPNCTLPESPNLDEKKVLWKTINNRFWTNDVSKITLKDLTNCFGRIRLIGPKILTILKEVLKVGQLPMEKESMTETQKKFWNTLERIRCVKHDTVVPLNVEDPRFELPSVRQRVQIQVPLDPDIKDFSIEDSMLKSRLWDEVIRRQVLSTKVSDLTLAKIRGENLIPGTNIDDKHHPNVIPVVLVIRSGSSSSKHSAIYPGADLILPAGWLMSFWVAFSYRCARVYGMEFNDYITFEGSCFSDQDACNYVPPDCVNYSNAYVDQEEKAKAKYFLRPPSKRSNFIKLGCPFPFAIDWARFLNLTYSQFDDENVCVVRRSKDRELIYKLCKEKRNSAENLELNIPDTHLIQVKLVLLKGSVGPTSCICIPTEQDMNLFDSKKPNKYKISQTQFEDYNESKRRELKERHQKTMARLLKKRKVARRAAKSESESSFDLTSRLKELDSVHVSESFNNQMNVLWTCADNIDEVLSKQCREVMGFTSYTHFSYRIGKGAACGYITVGQFKKLYALKSKKLYVLVRDWAVSLDYYWAELRIV